MFFSDPAVVEQTKSLARRAEQVLALADANGQTPEVAAALLAMGKEIAGALTKLSTATQATSVLDAILSSLCTRAEDMQEALQLSEDALQAAFAWPAAPVNQWDDTPLVAVEFHEDELETFWWSLFEDEAVDAGAA